ncbi:MAG: DnaJ domain-containing protein [Candidatus Paceibacterota bacterium]|nr:MAG: DnaJ domain-containing protein [Candidatus Paceibacterota bacterium]
MKDPYSVLGVSRSASADEIKKAFRSLAHKYHPDKKGGDAEKFKEVNEAYQVLSDTEKRAQYDRFGFAGQGSYGGGQHNGGHAGFDGTNFWDFFGGGGGQQQQSGFGFEDIFSMFSGAGGFGGAPRGPQKGEDMYFQVQVDKKDLGKTRTFSFEGFVPCTTCHTSGVKPGSRMKSCETCKGSGQVRQQVRTPFGVFAQTGVCSACEGQGEIPEKKCDACDGVGRSRGKKTVEIHIPEKLEGDYAIALPQFGHAGTRGAPAGDVVITLKR